MDKVYCLYKISHWSYIHHLELFSKFCRFLLRILFSCDIHYKAQIGEGTTFPHAALGVVIHPDAVIGNNCKILHCTTLGGRGNHTGLPIIGDNVLIGCHAQVLGPVKIGDNSIIGANSVVISSIPSNSIAIGSPAVVVKSINS